MKKTIDCLDSSYLKDLLPKDYENFSFEEEVVFLSALMPHISPESLDLLSIQSKELDWPYIKFGG